MSHTILLCRFFCEKNHDFAGFMSLTLATPLTQLVAHSDAGMRVIFDDHRCASRLNDTDNVAVFLVQGPGFYFLLFCCFEILMNSILLQVYSAFASGLQGAR